MEKTVEKKSEMNIEDIANSIKEKYKDQLKDRRTSIEEGDLLARAEKEYGLDSGSLIEDPWERIRERSKLLEETLNDSILDSKEPKEILSPLEKIRYHSLAITSKEKAERYAHSQAHRKVKKLLTERYQAVEVERLYLDQVIHETNISIKNLIERRQDSEKAHDRSDRYRMEADKKCQTLVEEMMALSHDLDKAISIDSGTNDMSPYISAIQNSIERKKTEREAYGEIIQQALTAQEGSSEQYDLLTGKLERERFTRSRLRDYQHKVSGISRRLSIYMQEGFEQAYKGPLERIGKIQEVMKDSVVTLNKLIDASYISKEILTDFPNCEVPTVVDIAKETPFDYNEHLQIDRANRKGIELSKTMREKRRAEFNPTYLMK